MLLVPGSVYNEFCQASSERRAATEPNLSRGKAHLSSWDDKPRAIQKQIAQLPHCEALRGRRLRAGNRDATDSWCYTGKRRRRREISNTLIYADGADGQPSLCSSSSSCTQNPNVTINSKERNLKINLYLLSSLRVSSFNKSPTLSLISSLCFTNIMTAVGPFPVGANKLLSHTDCWKGGRWSKWQRV